MWHKNADSAHSFIKQATEICASSPWTFFWGGNCFFFDMFNHPRNCIKLMLICPLFGRLPNKIRGLNSVEITPVNGDSSSGNPFDIKKAFPSSAVNPAASGGAAAAAGKGSKLESALDKLGLGKRKVSCPPKSKINSGLFFVAVWVCTCCTGHV